MLIWQHITIRVLVVSASIDDSIRIWDSHTGECLKVLQGHTDSVRSAAFNFDDSLIVSAGKDNSMRIWDTQTGVCLKVFEASSVKVSFKRS